MFIGDWFEKYRKYKKENLSHKIWKIIKIILMYFLLVFYKENNCFCEKYLIFSVSVLKGNVHRQQDWNDENDLSFCIICLEIHCFCNGKIWKKRKKMPALLITEVCGSTAGRWPAYMIYLAFLNYFLPSNISKGFTELHRSLCSFGMLKFSNSISQIFIDEKIRSLELLFQNCFLASWHEWGKQELIF